MATIPHLAYPLRFTGGTATLNEQDSPADVTDCIAAILTCPLGHRTEQPDFGITEQALRENGADLTEINAAIARWEPRARSSSEHATAVDALVDTIRVTSEATNA